MAGLWLLGSVAAGLLTVFEINERLDNAIEEVAQRLLPATYDAVQQPRAMQQMTKNLVATMDPKALAYQIIGPTGDIVMRSENAPEKPFPVPRQAGFHDTPRYRVVLQPDFPIAGPNSASWVRCRAEEADEVIDEVSSLFRDRDLLLANLGYFGHMWELYAMWAWVLVYVSEALVTQRMSVLGRASLLTFVAIAGHGTASEHLNYAVL